jgi:hypothetical protein
MTVEAAVEAAEVTTGAEAAEVETVGNSSKWMVTVVICQNRWWAEK